MVKTIKYLLGLRIFLKVSSRYDNGKPQIIHYKDYSGQESFPLFRYKVFESKAESKISYVVYGSYYDIEKKKRHRIKYSTESIQNAEEFFIEFKNKHPQSHIFLERLETKEIKKYI